MPPYVPRQMTAEEAAAKKARLDALFDEAEAEEDLEAEKKRLEEQKYKRGIELHKEKMALEAAVEKRLAAEAKALRAAKRKKKEQPDNTEEDTLSKEEGVAPVEVPKKKPAATKKKAPVPKTPKAPPTPKAPKAPKASEVKSPVQPVYYSPINSGESSTFQHPFGPPTTNNESTPTHNQFEAPAETVAPAPVRAKKKRRQKRVTTVANQYELDLANRESMRAAFGNMNAKYAWMNPGGAAAAPPRKAPVNQVGSTLQAPISLDSDDEKEVVSTQKPVQVADTTLAQVENGLAGSVDVTGVQNNSTDVNGENDDLEAELEAAFDDDELFPAEHEVDVGVQKDSANINGENEAGNSHTKSGDLKVEDDDLEAALEAAFDDDPAEVEVDTSNVKSPLEPSKPTPKGNRKHEVAQSYPRQQTYKEITKQQGEVYSDDEDEEDSDEDIEAYMLRQGYTIEEEDKATEAPVVSSTGPPTANTNQEGAIYSENESEKDSDEDIEAYLLKKGYTKEEENETTGASAASSTTAPTANTNQEGAIYSENESEEDSDEDIEAYLLKKSYTKEDENEATGASAASSPRKPMANITNIPQETGSASSNKRTRDEEDEKQNAPQTSPRLTKKPRVKKFNSQTSPVAQTAFTNTTQGTASAKSNKRARAEQEKGQDGPMKKPRVSNSNPQPPAPVASESYAPEYVAPMSIADNFDASQSALFRNPDGSFDHEAHVQWQLTLGPLNLKKKIRVPRGKRGEERMST
ncbi:hypothetical protein HYALB_00013106 [Hymenoscyphus albidus]|uniref:Uncharacterized protein n=1 Tax=Hymenoscyphus albidus TaxID=595503 RepID=A0A9N9LS10_9HELO|nr:hypothetical protein HYALB_00013106 [Hymenoscyphus albidus]